MISLRDGKAVLMRGIIVMGLATACGGTIEDYQREDGTDEVQSSGQQEPSAPDNGGEVSHAATGTSTATGREVTGTSTVSGTGIAAETQTQTQMCYERLGSYYECERGVVGYYGVGCVGSGGPSRTYQCTDGCASPPPDVSWVGIPDDERAVLYCAEYWGTPAGGSGGASTHPGSGLSASGAGGAPADQG